MGNCLMVLSEKTTEIFEALSLSRGAWLIYHITIERWGNEVIIHAQYDPEEANTTFYLNFRDCRKMVWDNSGIDDAIDERDFQQADVIGMDISESQHRKPAVITTDLFEIAINYGELVIQKDW